MTKTMRVPNAIHEEVTEVAQARGVTTGEALKLMVEGGRAQRDVDQGTSFEELPPCRRKGPDTGREASVTDAYILPVGESNDLPSPTALGGIEGAMSVPPSSATVVEDVFNEALEVLRAGGLDGIRIAEAALGARGEAEVPSQ